MTSARSFLFALVLFPLQSSLAQTPPVVHLTADQDHQRRMDLLHIPELRRGQAGAHTLHFCMVDPAVVLEKLVITRPLVPSPRAQPMATEYLGPPESFHR